MRENLRKDQFGNILTMEIEPLYTIDEAAQLLKRSPKTLLNMASARQLTVIKGRPLLVPLSSIKEFLTKRTQKALV